MECKWWRLELCRRRQWQPTPVLLPGKSNGQRSLVGYSPWGQEESDTTEWLHFHFSLSSTGKGNGNPLQCSCLENPRDGGAWWAAVYGVAQSRTRLKRLSSSSMKFSNFTKGRWCGKETMYNHHEWGMMYSLNIWVKIKKSNMLADWRRSFWKNMFTIFLSSGLAVPLLEYSV